MSTSQITFFPVGNGDMTLIETTEGKRILVDCNIRQSSQDESNSEFDCLDYLQEKDMMEMDALILTHSDQDHCRGIEECFNLCAYADKDDEKIFVKEIIVPAKFIIDDDLKNDDAKALKVEVMRRLDLYGTARFDVDGNRVQIVGYSVELSEYNDIITPAGKIIEKINNEYCSDLELMVLRPVKKDTDGDSTNVNDSCITLKTTFQFDNFDTVAILGGDLTCDNWIEVIGLNPNLTFDVMIAPHHCSWHSISNEDTHTGNVNEEISDFLESSKDAYIIASCKTIKRNEDNPPSFRAMNEYKKHAKKFICLADYPDSSSPEPYVLIISGQGITENQIINKKAAITSGTYKKRTYGSGE